MERGDRGKEDRTSTLAPGMRRATGAKVNPEPEVDESAPRCYISVVDTVDDDRWHRANRAQTQQAAKNPPRPTGGRNER